MKTASNQSPGDNPRQRGLGAIVTGSTSGIGLAIAQALARAGTNAMLNGFGDRDAIEALRRELAAETGAQVADSAADMSQTAEIARMVAQAETEFGSVDILVNNAGVQFVAPVDEFPDAKWEQIIGIDLSADFYAIKAVLPGMKRRNLAGVNHLDRPATTILAGWKRGMISL